jgi:hypothetical protein
VTGGGPGKATETLVYKVYNDGFVGLNHRLLAAQSVILMAIVIALTAFQFRLSNARCIMAEVEPWSNRSLRARLPHRALVLIARRRDRRFPVYYTFVASTHRADDPAPADAAAARTALRRELQAAVRRGSAASAASAGVRRMLANTLHRRAGDRVGKIAISILSAYRDRLLPLSVPDGCFWLIFITLMLPVEVRILPTYKVDGPTSA